MRAEEYLRRVGISKELPGYEYLKLAAVLSIERGINDEMELINEVTKEASVIKKVTPEDMSRHEQNRGPVEQDLVEAIRSVSPTNVKIRIIDFIDEMVLEMKE